MLAVAGLLRQNRTVLISSELFGATTEPGQTFWSLHQLFAPLCAETCVPGPHLRGLCTVRTGYAHRGSLLRGVRSGGTEQL